MVTWYELETVIIEIILIILLKIWIWIYRWVNRSIERNDDDEIQEKTDRY